MEPPTFIVCAPRSGSTLLSWLIGSHPLIGSPAETDAGLVVGQANVVKTTLVGEAHWGKTTVEGMIQEYLDAKGKQIWCDKSLSNVRQLPLLAQTWPEARFIFLYRHMADFINSALDSSPFRWDFYGFGSYIMNANADMVLGMTCFWLDHVTAMLRGEARLPEGQVLRVRYEDLVTDTEGTLSKVWDFMGVDAPPAEMDPFAQPHDWGWGDHKIWYTDRISTDEIGRGNRILVPYKYQRDAANVMLKELGYEEMGALYGSGDGPIHSTDVEYRVVKGAKTIASTVVKSPYAGIVAVDHDVRDQLMAGTLNLARALRHRWLRWYGAPFKDTGEETEFYRVVPKILAEMT